MSALSDSPITSSPTDLYVGGQWRAAASGDRLPIEDPATGETLTEVADAAPEDALAALDAACEAQADWARTTPRERGEILRRAYEAVMAELEDLALLITLEMGKPLHEARAEVNYAADFFHWFAGEATRIDGRWSMAEKGGSRVLVSKGPVGPCLFITPWNFPLAMGTRKIGPAIASGCTMVVKPAGQTPLAMLRLANVLEKAGLPAGVLNVVTSSDHLVGEELTLSPLVDLISFTGSTVTGKRIMEKGAATLKRVFLELGGKSAMIVLDDADFASVVPGGMSVCAHGGQGCAMQTRMLLPRSRYDEGVELITAAMGMVPYGDPQRDDVLMGPLVSKKQQERVLAYIRKGVDEGAKLVVGGGRPANEPTGWFVEPTLFVDVDNTMTIAQEEIFGPVLAVIAYDDDDDAVRIANDSTYGLSGGVYGSPDRATAIARRIRTGSIGVNGGAWYGADSPYGGYKTSGVGRQNGIEGFEQYLETKAIAWPAD